MKSQNRKEFEKAEWATDDLGYPVNPKANKTCKTCDGHGVVDVGYSACLLENCPDCHTAKEDI